MAMDILIVDDEDDIRDLIAGVLEDEGYRTRGAHDSDSALQAVNARRPNLVFLDIWMQGSTLDGLQTLDALHTNHGDIPVVMISGHGNVETAVSAIKRGAYDYIEKPFKIDRLLLVAQRAMEASRLQAEVADLREKTGDGTTEIIGDSALAAQLRTMLEKTAPTNSRVLLTGAMGVGKSLSARVIHASSTRADGPLIEVNLTMYPPQDVMSVLFGEETEGREGIRVEAGALERAHGGTLFLGEISAMSDEVQTGLLRALVENQFKRVNGQSPVQVDVRFIASTSANINRMIDEGKFRADLFHRLAVVPVKLPSLKERREDVPPLVTRFIAQLSKANNQPVVEIAEDALAVLQAQDWPGNIRQLRNSIERLLILVRDTLPVGGQVTAAMLPPDIGEVLPTMNDAEAGTHLMSLPLRDAREVFERQYLMAQIERFGGNISRTAEFVGMERSALHRKLRSLGL
ncbi:MAG: sigma-54-dependent Fis family transcriptional regulator [Alphaproteobacteria bacterium]|nr:sigma-54-dependent Fis family transcriptional regulator [Alphaproteobacteria bacterium]